MARMLFFALYYGMTTATKKVYFSIMAPIEPSYPPAPIYKLKTPSSSLLLVPFAYGNS
jgi:hypothetical protein